MLRLSLFAASAVAELRSLQHSDMDEFLSTHNESLVLIKFFAPWCGHCKSMKEDYETAAKQLVGKAALAEVNCDDAANKDTCGKYGVQGFPTLKYINKGVVGDYDGGRSLNDFLEWADDMGKPLVSTDDVVPHPTKPVIILHAKELLAEFHGVAEKNRKVGKYFHVKSDEASKIQVQHPDEDVIECTEISTEESIQKCIDAHRLPKVGELNAETFTAYTLTGRPIVWCLFPMTKAEMPNVIKENKKMMIDIAQGVSHLGVSITYTDTDTFKGAIESMLGVKEFPRIVYQKSPQDKKVFVYDGAMEAGPIIQHIQDASDGKIAAVFKSEEPPASGEAEDVTVVVGKTLQEIVFNNDKDVLFEIYAPWCGHCKNLIPEYEKLAKKVAKTCSDFVTIAKMDGTLNDSPVDSIQWTGFPTILFVKAGSQEVVNYTSGRTAKDMWAFIRENGANKDKIQEALTAAEAPEQHDEL